MARMGTGPAKHKYEREHPDLMFAGTVSKEGRTFITPDPELARDPRKLAGKTVGLVYAMEADHWSSPMVLSLSMLRDAWGIYGEVKKVQVRMADLSSAFESGKADAVFCGVVSNYNGKFTIPEPLSALLKQKQHYWVPLSQTDVEKINATNDYRIRLISVPRGSLSMAGPQIKTVNPPEDVTMADFCVALTVWRDTEEEVVYELLKFIVDNAAKFAEGATRRTVGPGAECRCGRE